MLHNVKHHVGAAQWSDSVHSSCWRLHKASNQRQWDEALQKFNSVTFRHKALAFLLDGRHPVWGWASQSVFHALSSNVETLDEFTNNLVEAEHARCTPGRGRGLGVHLVEAEHARPLCSTCQVWCMRCTSTSQVQYLSGAVYDWQQKFAKWLMAVQRWTRPALPAQGCPEVDQTCTTCSDGGQGTWTMAAGQGCCLQTGTISTCSSGW